MIFLPKMFFLRLKCSLFTGSMKLKTDFEYTHRFALYSVSKMLYFKCSITKIHITQRRTGEARWPSGRASDSGARDREFDPHSGRRVVSLSKIHLPPKSTGNTQEAVALSRHD